MKESKEETIVLSYKQLRGCNELLQQENQELKYTEHEERNSVKTATSI